MEGGFVDEEPVNCLAMLVESFAVVGGHDEQGVVALPRLGEHCVETAHQIVGPGDLAVVQPAGVSRRVRFGRLVGIVRIVEVHPCEAPLRSGLAKPCRRFGHCRVSAFLDGIEEPCVVVANLEPVGVGVEPATESGLLRQHDRRYEGAGSEPASLQDLGEQRHARAQRRRYVVSNPMFGRVEPGKQRDMRGPRERHLRRRVQGHRALARQPIQVGRGHGRVAVYAQTIGAERVDGDQHQVPGGARCGWWLGCTRGARRQPRDHTHTDPRVLKDHGRPGPPVECSARFPAEIWPAASASRPNRE